MKPEEKQAFDELAVRERFVIVDGHALIYRAYHAFPGLTDPQGMLVNAVYGFTRILLTAIRDQEPTYLALAFDHKDKTHRAQEYQEYKANRAEMPDDLKPQIALCKEVVSALAIPQFEVAGYEADDLIGTIARQMQEKNGLHNLPLTVIVTGDKDLFQLVTPDVHVWLPGRGKGSIDMQYGPAEVLSYMKVRPDQITDLKALMGDASDNIPGVKGVGAKTAVALISKYGCLTAVYDRVTQLQDNPELKDTLIKGSLFTKLVQDKANAFLSQKLATITTQAPINFSLEDCIVSNYDKEQAVAVLEKLGFKSLMGLLPKDAFEMGVQASLF